MRSSQRDAMHHVRLWYLLGVLGIYTWLAIAGLRSATAGAWLLSSAAVALLLLLVLVRREGGLREVGSFVGCVLVALTWPVTHHGALAVFEQYALVPLGAAILALTSLGVFGDYRLNRRASEDLDAGRRTP